MYSVCSVCIVCTVGLGLDAVVRKDLEIAAGGPVVVSASGPRREVEEDLVDAAGPCIDPQSREFRVPQARGPRPDVATEEIIAGLSGIAAGLGRFGVHAVAHIIAGPLGAVTVASAYTGAAAAGDAGAGALSVTLAQQRESMQAFAGLMRDMRRFVKNDRLHEEGQALVRRAQDLARTVEQILGTASNVDAYRELIGVHNTLVSARSEWIVGDDGERSTMLLLPAAGMAEAHVGVLTLLTLLSSGEEEAEHHFDRWNGLRVSTAAGYGVDLLAMRQAATAWRVEQYQPQDEVEWEDCRGVPLDPAVFDPPEVHWMTRLWEFTIGLHDERLSASLCPVRHCWLEDSYMCPENARDVLGSVRTYERFMFTQLRETFIVPPHVVVPFCDTTDSVNEVFAARRAELTATLKGELQRSLDRTVTGILLPQVRHKCAEGNVLSREGSLHLDTSEAELQACFSFAAAS